jgi:hypothetical protein
LNDQVYNKSAVLENVKERLEYLSELMEKDLSKVLLPDTSFVSESPKTFKDFIGQTELHEEPQIHEVVSKELSTEREADYKARIMELEAEVRALSLYVTKMISRVVNNQQLQSALFSDGIKLGGAEPSSLMTGSLMEELPRSLDSSPLALPLVPPSSKASVDTASVDTIDSSDPLAPPSESPSPLSRRPTNEWIKGLGNMFSATAGGVPLGGSSTF